MVVFIGIFGRLARLPSDGGAPYPVMVFAGLLPWFLFSTILSEASNSLAGIHFHNCRSIQRHAMVRGKPLVDVFIPIR
jgi:hypothetical protein